MPLDQPINVQQASPACHRPHHALSSATRLASLIYITYLILEDMRIEQQAPSSMQHVPSFVLVPGRVYRGRWNVLCLQGGDG